MIYSLGIAIGLTVKDIDDMTFGEIMDLAYYKANQQEDQKNLKENKRNATQADYDSF